MRGSMSANFSPLIRSMICPFFNFPVSAAGDPSSTFFTRIVKAG